MTRFSCSDILQLTDIQTIYHPEARGVVPAGRLWLTISKMVFMTLNWYNELVMLWRHVQSSGLWDTSSRTSHAWSRPARRGAAAEPYHVVQIANRPSSQMPHLWKGIMKFANTNVLLEIWNYNAITACVIHNKTLFVAASYTFCTFTWAPIITPHHGVLVEFYVWWCVYPGSSCRSMMHVSA